MAMYAQKRTAETLRAVEQQFPRWRRARGGYGRIPHELWEAAAKAAAVNGIEDTASRLQLDAGKLKRWMRVVGKRERALSSAKAHII